MTGLVCWLIQRRLGAYRDGELGPAARAKTAGHLARCKACGSELALLGRLRAAVVRVEVPDPGEAAWEAFWPGVRARLAAPPVPEPRRRPEPRRWASVVRDSRIAVGSAVAVAAVAVLAVLAPWEPSPAPEAPRLAVPLTARPVTPPSPVSSVVVHAVETEAPDSSVMIFSNEEPGVTVVWVFGLERT
jgi:anti-sigma factor RsiW